MIELFKRLMWLLLLLLALALAALGWYAVRSFPQLDGELRVERLGAPVRIERDAADVTHIRAQSARDAWYALGWVHAQERGWQLEFNRRLMRGELAEILGPDALDTDRLIRTLGILRAADQQLRRLPEEDRIALEAYADGINAFHDSDVQALQPEFHLLRVRPGRWTPFDSVGWSIMMALDLSGNWGNEFARLSAAQVLDTAQLWQLLPAYDGEPPASQSDLARLYNELGVYRGASAKAAGSSASEASAQAPSQQVPIREGLSGWRDWGLTEGIGSNNWVVAGSRSQHGKPLLANDPHLGLTAPAVWYVARLQSPEMDVIGATLPGLPFVVLGRTRGVAWGFTNTGPDVQDLYIEQINPDNPKQYRTPEGWADFTERSETIAVKGQGPVTLTVRETRHGPVLSDVQKTHGELLDTRRFVLALRWSALDPANHGTLSAGLRANRAQTVDDLLAAYADYHSPMQNVGMADTAGHTAFKVIGQAPLRQADNDLRGVAPAPGWDARYDWSGWLPYEETPVEPGSAIEARGWRASANQRIHGPDYPHFLGQDWMPPYRQQRIEQRLAELPRHDLASLRAVQGDTLSLGARKLLPHLLRALEKQTSFGPRESWLDVLRTKGADMSANQPAGLMIAAWADELTRLILIPKLGEEKFKSLYGRRTFRQALEGILERDDNFWCGPGGCDRVSGQAIEIAHQRLAAQHGERVADWRWGEAHPAVSAHRPFGNLAVLDRWFDVRVASGGDHFTINVGQYDPAKTREPFANRHAASYRGLYDLADPEQSRFIYQTGQSGLVFSPRYRDMRDEWAAVTDRPLQMNPREIRHLLTLTP